LLTSGLDPPKNATTRPTHRSNRFSFAVREDMRIRSRSHAHGAALVDRFFIRSFSAAECSGEGDGFRVKGMPVLPIRFLPAPSGKC